MNSTERQKDINTSAFTQIKEQEEDYYKAIEKFFSPLYLRYGGSNNSNTIFELKKESKNLQSALEKSTFDDNAHSNSSNEPYIRKTVEVIQVNNSKTIEEKTVNDSMTLIRKKQYPSKPYLIITERKTKQDAILKKINKSFFDWIIQYLNRSTPQQIRFIKVSKFLIKTITKRNVNLIMFKSLFEILEEDNGSQKYLDAHLNKKMIRLIHKDNRIVSQEINDFLALPLCSIYNQYFVHFPFKLKGPSYYTLYYDYLRTNYLSYFSQDC